MGFRAPNEKNLDGERAFMLASTQKAIEEADLPVKVRNFSKKSQGGNAS